MSFHEKIIKQLINLQELGFMDKEYLEKKIEEIQRYTTWEEAAKRQITCPGQEWLPGDGEGGEDEVMDPVVGTHEAT